MNESQIRLFITGGTIDDVDYEREDFAPLDKASYVPSLLRQSRVRVPYEYEIILQKDSRFINEQDQNFILEKCRNSQEDKLLITHGTYTMSATAKVLGNANLDKTIVLFGSMVPVNKEGSDALFNLGSAFTSVQLLAKGVYIISNGKIFSWENVRKNDDGKFFELERPEQ